MSLEWGFLRGARIGEMSETTDLKALLAAAGPIKVGKRIRRARERLGISIRELARLSEISKNTLLRLELGHGSHFATVRQVSRCMGIKLRDLLSPEFGETAVIGLHHYSDWLWYDLQNYRGGAYPVTRDEFPPEKRRQVADGLGTNLFALLKSRMPEDFFHPSVMELYRETEVKSHPGEEFCYVLSGRVCVKFESKSVVLEENDSLTFYASEVHSYEPLDELPARLLSIVLHIDIQNWHRESQGWEH